MADAEAEATAAPPKKKSKALVWVLIAVIVLAGGAGGAFFFMKKDKAKVAEKPKPAPAIYYQFDPAFVVNFEAEQLVRFLQVTIGVMSRDQPTVDFLKQHDPALRNDLLLLLATSSTRRSPRCRARSSCASGRSSRCAPSRNAKAAIRRRSRSSTSPAS